MTSINVELRVAARRRGTYWVRFTFAAVGGCLGEFRVGRLKQLLGRFQIRLDRLLAIFLDGQLVCRSCTSACAVCSSSCLPGAEVCDECAQHLYPAAVGA